MLQECPHCHTGVFVGRDNTCPACRKNIKDLAGAELDVTSVTLHDARSLPPYCAACGRDTNRTQKMRPTRKDPDADDLSDGDKFILAGSGFLGVLFAAILTNKKDRMQFNVPYCERCRRSKRTFVVRHVNWETRQATLLVHVEFKKRLVEYGYYERGV